MKSLLMLTLLSNITLAFGNLIGTYDLKVKINGRTFNDVLRLETFGENLLGEFEVPGVFRAPFIGIHKKRSIRGHFIAKESGGEFRVDLEGDFTDVCNVQGNLFQGRNVFAVFTGAMRGCNELSN